MNQTRTERLRLAGLLVPALVETAQKAHTSDMHVKIAVLGAWASLAGITGWTPAMLTKIERAMKAGKP